MHHYWGDEGVDWDGINNAAEYIGEFCKKYGRIGGTYKEKYGTVRFYAMFYSCFLSLTHPGYCNYSPYPKWLAHLDIYYGPTILKYLGVSFILYRWQPFIYNLAYQRALKKWPHLRAEILANAEYLELIKGVWRKEGNKTHVLGWNGETVATWETM